MTEGRDELQSMQLSGYVMLAEQGFALPAYVAQPGANAWYSALPAIEGDHASTIAGFELLEEENIHPIYDNVIVVRPGDRWQDVFLCAGRVFTGEPSQIFDSVAQYKAQLRELAPLSFLDLAIAAGAPSAAELTKDALKFFEARLGGDAGAASFRELVLRPGALVELRRQYRQISGAPLPESLSNLNVRKCGPEQFEIEMAPSTAAALGGAAAAAKLDASISRFGDLVGLQLRTTGLDGSEQRLTIPEITLEKPPVPRGDQTVLRKPVILSFPKILIIAADRRAAQIARYIEAPREFSSDAASIWGSHNNRVKRARKFNSVPESTNDALIHVVEAIDQDTQLDDFAVVVWLEQFRLDPIRSGLPKSAGF